MLSKRKRNDVTTIFTFITISFKYALLTKREVVNMTACYYMAKFLFCILLDFLKFLNFFSWLVMPGDFFVRSVAVQPDALKLASLTFKNL